MTQKRKSDPASRPQRAAGNFYGRRKAKRLKPGQAEARDALLPQLRIDLAQAPPQSLGELFPGHPDKVNLEIGFGGGEHLIHCAMLYPDVGLIGCEPFINGMAKATQGIGDNAISNIRLYDEDATDLLDWLPNASLAQIDLLYPDPWPKKRHWKRRFLNADNVKRFYRALEEGGKFRFASDIESYVNWGLRHVLDFQADDGGRFEWTAQASADWHEPWPNWLSTRYEKKALREGRVPCYMVFEKTQS